MGALPVLPHSTVEVCSLHLEALLRRCYKLPDTILKLSKAVLDFHSFTDQVTKQELKSRITLTGLFVGFADVANQQVSALRCFRNGFGL